MHEGIFGVHAEHQNHLVRKFLQDGLGGGEAAHSGEGAIHDDDVGAMFARQSDGVFAIARFGDNLQVRFVFQNAAETEADEVVIVNEND